MLFFYRVSQKMSVRCAALASPEGGGGELKSLRLQKKFFCGRWAKMALLIQKVADPWARGTHINVRKPHKVKISILDSLQKVKN